MTIYIVKADAIQWLEEEAAHGERFDCIFTDPPYDSLLKWQGIGTTARMGFGIRQDATKSDKFYNCIDANEMRKIFDAFSKLLKNNSHCYIMSDHEYMPLLLAWAREKTSGFKYSKPLVWDKVNMGMGYHWRSRHEYIVMLEKGTRRLNDLGKADVLTHKRVTGGYPTEKPFSLVEEVILNSTQSGDWVLDPFAGSGVVGAVCKKHDRNCVMIDNSDTAIALINTRLGTSI